jgi:hypothetical protein
MAEQGGSILTGYPPQEIRIAFRSAVTLEKPKAKAAALIFPNCWTSAETLLPWQLRCPAKS